jgi:hypothetical protein
MLKLRSAVFGFITFSAVLSADVARAADVGLISSIAGDVQVARPPGSKFSKASLMQSLADGSRVKVAPNSRAVVILFQGGTRYELGPGSVTTFAPGTCRKVSGPAPKPLPALQIRQAKLLQSSRVASGRAASTTIRGGPERIELHSLSATAVQQARPVFVWGALPGATAYKVRLWDENGELVWQREALTPRLDYPTEAPSLKPNTDYLWTVTSTVDDTVFKGEGNFQVLDDEKSRAVKVELDALDFSQDDAVAGVLRAEVFARYELWDDAIAIYQQLDTKFPASEAIRNALSELLIGQGRIVKNSLSLNPAPATVAPTH